MKSRLEDGTEFEVRLNYNYSTRDYNVGITYCRSGELGTTLRWGELDLTKPWVSDGLDSCVFENIRGIHSGYVLSFDRLILPKDIQQIFITRFITIKEPIMLPKTIIDVKIPKYISISNLEEFTYMENNIRLI